MKLSFQEAMQKRRSIYAIGKTKTVTHERIKEIVDYAVTHVPSPFNSQSGRIIMLFDKESDKFWDITRSELKKVVAPDKFESAEERIKGFESGYGTILFFEDQTVVQGLMDSFPTYAANFPIWSLQSNGMLEYAVWVTLEAEGLGASLQHYNPLVDEAVRKAWNVPESWKLLAEMPFGSVEAPAGEKTFQGLESRVKVY